MPAAPDAAPDNCNVRQIKPNETRNHAKEASQGKQCGSRAGDSGRGGAARRRRTLACHRKLGGGGGGGGLQQRRSDGGFVPVSCICRRRSRRVGFSLGLGWAFPSARVRGFIANGPTAHDPLGTCCAAYNTQSGVFRDGHLWFSM